MSNGCMNPLSSMSFPRKRPKAYYETPSEDEDTKPLPKGKETQSVLLPVSTTQSSHVNRQGRRKLYYETSSDSEEETKKKPIHEIPSNHHCHQESALVLVPLKSERPMRRRKKAYYETPSPSVASSDEELAVRLKPLSPQCTSHEHDDKQKVLKDNTYIISTVSNAQQSEEQHVTTVVTSRKIRNPIQESRQYEETLRKLFENTSRYHGPSNKLKEDELLWNMDSCTSSSGDESIKHKNTSHINKGKRKGIVERKKNKVSLPTYFSEPMKPSSLSDPSLSHNDSRDISKIELEPNLEDDEVYLSQQLKPIFHNPKLGPPSALVPFILTRCCSSHEQKPHPDPDQPTLIDDDTVPASINRYLQDYQRDGIQYMHSVLTKDKGFILGDDMGLGKTVQVISLLAAFQKKTGTALDLKILKQREKSIQNEIDHRQKDSLSLMMTGKQKENMPSVSNKQQFTPTLIIVPASVIDNWKRELDTWGHFAVSVYRGKNEKREQLDRVRIGLATILITGKSLFIDDDNFASILKIPWKLIIVDELHDYKNPKSKSYMHLMNLRDVAKCPILGLTGTLMSNNHAELWSLVDLVQPNLLGSYEAFKKLISEPIMQSRRKDASKTMIEEGDLRQRQLAERLPLVYLRRDKDGVLKHALTSKEEKVVFCELSDIQKKIYQRMLLLPDYRLLRFARSPCDCGVNQNFFMGYQLLRTRKEQMEYQRRHKHEVKSRGHCCYGTPTLEDGSIDPEAVLWRNEHLDGLPCPRCPYCILLPALSKLSKVCSHPSHLQVERDPNYIYDEELRKKAIKNLAFAEVLLTPDILDILPGRSCIRGNTIMDDHMMLSGKMQALDFYLHVYKERRDDKVIVFSYSTTTLDLIQNHISSKGYSFMRVDGSVPQTKRQDIFDKFQKDANIFVMLASTKACGQGVNLAAANRVIIFDVCWNPSHDEQAQDRAYRIGQLRNVEVIRLVARGTIEELMYARQIYKIQLKKKTLESTDDPSAPQPARLFCGVDKDRSRKGELFGVENLMKYKDGSFMTDLWKSNENNKDRNIKRKAPLVIATERIEEFVGKYSEEQIEHLGDVETIVDVIPEAETIAEDDLGDDDGIVRHADFLTEDRGGAVHDDVYGGETQMAVIACELGKEKLGATALEHQSSCEIEYESPVQKRRPCLSHQERTENKKTPSAHAPHEQTMEPLGPIFPVHQSKDDKNKKTRSLFKLPCYLKKN